MSPEPFDEERIATLDDPAAFQYCSGEELRELLDPAPDWRVADFGSGTGRFTSELAPVVDTVFAIDVRSQLHEVYRENGIPEPVVPILGDFGRLPFEDCGLDGAISVRTFHHGFDAELDEAARVLRPGGRLVIVDWSSTGAGDRDAVDADEYFDPATVQSMLLDAGFRITEARERYETFVIVAAKR